MDEDLRPEGTDVGSSEMSLGRRFLDVKTLASFAVAFAILFFLATRVKVDVGATIQAVKSANPFYFAIALVSYYLVFPVRALRWRQMLRNSGTVDDELPGLFSLMRIIFLSWFANCLVPAKLGDIYRAYLLKRWEGISGSKAGGTILAERVIDLATLLFLAALTGLLSLRGQPSEKLQELAGPLEALSVVVLLAAVALVAMRFWSKWVRALIPARLHGLYERFEEGAIGGIGALQILLPYSVLVWVFEALRLFFVSRSIGLNLTGHPLLDLAAIVTIALVGSLLTALPLTPAGLGFVESGMVAALLLFGVKDESLAFSVAFLDRTISYVSLVVLGLVVYLASFRSGKRATS